MEWEHLMGWDHLAEHAECPLVEGAGDAVLGHTGMAPALMELLR